MFDLGGAEILVIGVVALIVIGPKDLPVMFQQVGKFVGRARGMAREFSYAMNQAADEAGVKDATKGFKSATDGLKTMANPAKAATDAVRDKVKDAADIKLDLGVDSLSEDRAAAAKKIQAATADKAKAAQEAEAAPKAAPKKAPKKAPAKTAKKAPKKAAAKTADKAKDAE